MRRPDGLTTSNWIDTPFNRWGFWHVRELTKTARISRGVGPVWDLPRGESDVEELVVAHEGQRMGWSDFLTKTFTDAMVVIHDGAIVYEWYTDGYGPTDTHLLMSCGKSLTATYAGALVGRGLIDPARTVVDHIPALAGTAWEGCTVQSVLDMRAGTKFDESDYDDPTSDGRIIEEVSGYRPRKTEGLPAGTAAWIATVENSGPHGGDFEYRSLLTDVLAWIIQEVTGEPFVTGFSRDIWSQIGAERDAEVIVDDVGFPAVEGGICATVRDFARFGLMCLQQGQVKGRQVIPVEWFDRLRLRDQDLIDAFIASEGQDPSSPDACYRDQWWVIDPGAGIYSAYGINGQQLLIHPPSNTVVAKFSTWPFAGSGLGLQDAGLFALCEGLRV